MMSRRAPACCDRGGRRAFLPVAACSGWLLACAAWSLAAEGNAPPELDKWEFYQEIELPEQDASSQYFDVILPLSVFDKARLDLGDLRLHDGAGAEVPYALRVRRPEFRDETFEAREFNRSVGEDKSIELSLDLGAEAQQHNQVDVKTAGTNFRRRAELDASDDSRRWRRLVEGDLLYFKSGSAEFDVRRLSYPPSRFRYLRLRVHADPATDEKAVEIVGATVHRRVEVTGEMVTLDGQVGPREAVRTSQGPGSAWIIELGGDRVPCQRIEVDVTDEDFARSYEIEAEGRPGWLREGDVSRPPEVYQYRPLAEPRDDEPSVPAPAYAPYGAQQPTYEAADRFEHRTSGLWRRLSSEPAKALVADFDEVRASRLRLKITDNRNPPLNVTGVRFTAPARQLVFARTTNLVSPLRLYYGNPRGTPPHYDLERNLPAEVKPAPLRLEFGPRQTNPTFVPEPKPLTERWPWLIYLVLATASAALAAILVSLARTAVVRYDAQQPVGADT